MTTEEQNIDSHNEPMADPAPAIEDSAVIELADTRYDDLVRNSNLATDIVTAFVANNHVRAEELPSIIDAIFERVSQWGTTEPVSESRISTVSASPVASAAPEAAAPPPPPPPPPPPTEVLKPAVPIRQSVTHDFLICLEDGKRFKSLKRHLSTDHNLSPEQYRERWGLPRDYPMTSPAYAAQRSALATAAGLGRGATSRRRAAEPVGETTQQDEPTDAEFEGVE